MVVTLIYLDHNATTPLDPQVRAEMEDCGEIFGNPSSLHAPGQQARRIVDLARSRVARLIGAQAEEILFTSGGTEANNLAILGTMAGSPGRRHLITSAIEHQAILNPCRHLESAGHPVTFLPVDGEGIVALDSLEGTLCDGTALVSVMLVNNDVGSLQPVGDIARRSQMRGALVHTDAVQAIGKIKVDVRALGVDLLSISGHKLYGPKGIGALYVRKGTKLVPISFGGHQERGLRPGTENVTAIAGFGKACEVAAKKLEAEVARLGGLRALLEEEVLRRIPGARINGRQAPRLPNTSNIAIDGLDGEALAINLDLLGVAVSTGSACSTVAKEPSHVLRAMGRSEQEARSAIRVSMGRSTGDDEIRRVIDLVCQAVEVMRRSRA